MTTIARQSVRATLKSLLDGFQAANPTLLRMTFSARPNGLGVELPGAFVGNLNEPNILHTSGVRQRNFATEIVLFDTFAPSNEEQAARLDIVLDALLDWFTAHADQIPGAIQAPHSVSDGELTIQGTGNLPSVTYRALSIGIAATIQEGRN